MTGEREQFSNFNLSVIFDKHAATVNESKDLSELYRERMVEVFVHGELNVLFLERAYLYEPRRLGINFPQDPVIDHLRYYIDAIPGNVRNEMIYRLHRFFNLNSGLSLNQQALYFTTLLEGVKELNEEGYNIGILYEDSVLNQQSYDSDIEPNKLVMTSPDYFKRTMELYFDDLIRSRDLNVYKQLEEIASEEREQTVNVLLVRGTGHSISLSKLPKELRDRVRFASTDIGFDSNNWFNRIMLIYMDGREPTPDEWDIAYKEKINSVV